MVDIALKIQHLLMAQRIDSYLAKSLQGQYSREEIKAALKKGNILLNQKVAEPRTMVKVGDVIEGRVQTEKHTALAAESTPLRIVYEDESVIVIDKAAGMVVHPGAGNKKGTLVNALLGRGGSLSSVGGRIRPGIVHRLDKETSGLLVVAKDNHSHRLLQTQFSTRTLSRTYIALVQGRVEFEEGRIEQSIGRHPKVRQKMAVVHSETAKEAETHYRVLKRFRRSTLLELKLMTGRTHQIRVHMAHLGYPLIGDSLYGKTPLPAGRHALHASKLEFIHPKTGKIMRFESELPEDFKKMIEAEEKV